MSNFRFQPLKWMSICVFFLSGLAFAEEGESKKQLKVTDFFRAPTINAPTLSPNGNLIVYSQNDAILVARPGEEFFELIPENKREYLIDITWVGTHTLMAKKRRASDNFNSFRVYRIDDSDSKLKIVRESHIEQQGYIVDPIIGDSNTAMLAIPRWKDNVRLLDVYNAKLFTEKPQKFTRRTRLNKNSENMSHWISNAQHRLFLAVSYDGTTPVLWRGNNDGPVYREIWRGTPGSEFTAVSVYDNDSKLWVLTNVNSDKIVLASFNLETLTFDDVKFSKEESDITRVIFHPKTRAPVALGYVVAGTRQYEFIDPEQQKTFEHLRDNFLQPDAYLIDSSYNMKHWLMISSAPDKTQVVNFCDLSKSNCLEVGSRYPWLDGVTFPESQVLKVKSSDDLEIESYLSMPNHSSDTAQIPLLVMPHGGPIGVRSLKAKSSHEKLLVYKGYAVLTVNYRGSSGYGKAFKAKGLQQWGRGIEDDIDLSIEAALKANPLLDKNNMCIFGSSYGGYSALISVIRKTMPYRCAISFAGVTDLTLRFSDAEVKNNSSLESELINIIGNPSTQREELMQYSPVYRYKEIDTPILLAHGTADERVDIEHSYRLRQLLKLRKFKHKFVPIDGLGHGLYKFKHLNKFYGEVFPFLEKHLNK